MNINYIYDASGRVEYAVVPITMWEQVQDYLSLTQTTITEEKQDLAKPKSFDPKKYFGMISRLGIDIEQELSKMRSEKKDLFLHEDKIIFMP